VRVNALAPGPIRTRMLATAMPGLDMSNVEKPQVVAEKVVELCLPSVTETGKCFDLRSGKFLAFQPPG
jgi:NAD(P)-dependent dehydrogenase (short-subunit alcohol dehydrogenase family)